MICFVTGANGFIGSHLVDELLKEGVKVRCLVRKTSDLKFLDTENVELVYGDITGPEDLRPHLKDVDTLFHLAALISAPNEATYRKVNVDGALRLYRDYAQVAPRKARFVFCSSLAATGPTTPDRMVQQLAHP